MEWLKVIHVAKRETGLDEVAYRALLEGAAHVATAAAITTKGQFLAVMRAFEALGFKRKASLFQAEWGCSEAQKSKILALWLDVGRNQDEAALASFIKRIARVESPRFLTVKLAANVIVALERMEDQKKKKEPTA